MKNIYKFYVDRSRHGDLEGQFTATQEEVDFAVGKTLYFYEPWGKHSGVEVTLTSDMFTVVSSDVVDVEAFDRLRCASGHCPLWLLSDGIADGAITLTEEERASAPPYFRIAIESHDERYVEAG